MANHRKPLEEVKENIVSTCITNDERRYVERYVDFTGLTTSQFFRRAAIEKLVRENMMPNPLAKYVDAAATGRVDIPSA